LYVASKPDSALVFVRAALAMARLASDRSREASLLGNLALIYETVGQLDSAVSYGHQALALARTVGDGGTEGSALQNLGNAYRRLGKADSSIAYLRASLASRRRTGDRNGEGRTIGSIGMVFNDYGARDSAAVYLRAAATILRVVGDRPGLAATAHLLGMVHQQLGIVDSALAYDREALALERQVGDRRNEGATLNNLIIVFTDLRQLDSALAYGQLALVARRDVRDRQGEGHTLEALAVVQARLGGQDSALVLLQQALTIARETNHRLVEAGLRENIADTFEVLGRSDSAFAYARAARVIALEVKDLGVEAKAVEHIANLHASSGNLTAARAGFDTASAIRNSLRRQGGPDFARTTLAERNTGLYENWAWAWARGSEGQSQPLAALAAAERGRAQALLDLMRDTTAQSSAGADLVAEGRHLVGAVTRTGAGGLYFLALPDTLLIWVAAPDGTVTLLRSPIRRDSLNALIGRLREHLGSEDSRTLLATRGSLLEGLESSAGLHPSTSNAWRTAAEDVASALLLERAQHYLGSAQEVVIVPHGPIAVVPFAVLPVGPSHVPFGAQRALRYSPSLGALDQAELRPAPAVRAGRTPLSLVVGNPTMPEVIASSGERSALTSLPGAEQESRSVARQLGAGSVTGPQASETYVRKRLGAAPVIHLATHGFAYSSADKARLSFIALAPDSLNDGALTVGELLGDPALRLTADLVVLSACQTGLGNLKQAEGTVGLQRAFLARGARSVLVSLWSVSDEATRRLMESFYRHWLRDSNHPSKAAALRLAQEEVRRIPGWEHPRNWAGFQLVGAR
jgi:CHAT domain-containing protein/Tfp pilus assembly protein PilF